MIRECTAGDMEMVREYLGDEPYGRVVLAAIEEYGVDQKFQTVYVDAEEETCRGVYLWLYRNLLLYCKDNKVEIDFLEQMFGIEAPDLVVGRKDNVNIVSWLLTDYQKEEKEQMPEIHDNDSAVIGCFADIAENGENWTVLSRI